MYVSGVNVYKQNEENLAIFRRRQVGLIYQFYNLIPILNVEENITLPLDLDNRKVDNKHLNSLLELLGLEKRKTRKSEKHSCTRHQKSGMIEVIK